MRPSASGRARAWATNASVNFDGRYAGPKTMRWGVEQSRNLMTVRAASADRDAEGHRHRDEARRRRISQLSVDRARRRRDDGRSSWSTPMRFSPTRAARSKPTTDRLCPGPQRQGDLPHRQSLRGHGKLQRAPTGTERPCRGRRSRTRQLLDPQAAYQMVHIMEGVVERGTATSCATSTGRCSARPARLPARPTCGSSAARPTSSAASTSATTSRVRWAACCAGRPHRGADLQAIRPDRSQGSAEGAVRRAGRHPHGAHRPRERQARLRHLPDRGRSRSPR